jgi:hypothetical protein
MRSRFAGASQSWQGVSAFLGRPVVVKRHPPVSPGTAVAFADCVRNRVLNPFSMWLGLTGAAGGTNMLTAELQYLLTADSNLDGYDHQDRLHLLLADLRSVADDLELDFGRALREAETPREERDAFAFDPCI